MRKIAAVGFTGILTLIMNGCGSDDGLRVGDSTALGDPGPSREGATRPALFLQGLAERYATEADPDQLETTNNEVRMLNASELDAFNDALEKVEVSRLEAQYAADDAKPSLETVKDQLRAATNLRKEVNRLSVEQYGKPYNQLDSEKVDRLFSLLKNDYSTIGLTAGQHSLTAPAHDCDVGTYPLTALASGPTWRLGTGWSTYYENRVNGQTDCDLVYAYQGTFTRMRGVIPKDATLLAWLGGGAFMRHTGYSDIVLGTGKVWLIYGHPSLVTLRMY